MKCVLFVVDAGNVRGSYPEPFWLTHAIRGHIPDDLRREVTLVGGENPELDSVALYYPAGKVAVIHYLGFYDGDGRRVVFCLNDLTAGNVFLEAARNFSAGNGDVLQELRTL